MRREDLAMSDIIAAHSAWLKAGGLSRRTYGERERWLRQADRELEYGLEESDAGEFQEWLGNEDWAPWTRAKAFYHLNAFFEWGIDPRHAQHADEPIFTENPLAGLRRPKARHGEPNPVSDEELEILLTKAREPYYTAVMLAVGAGLRCMELAAIERKDITSERLFVRRGKGAKTASVPMQEQLWSHVKDFPPGRLIEHVGGVGDGRVMSARATNYFQRTLKLYGVCLHRCRHKYAELLRRGGADIATISRGLRHANLSSTQIYARATEAECRLAVQALRLPTPTPSRMQKP